MKKGDVVQVNSSMRDCGDNSVVYATNGADKYENKVGTVRSTDSYCGISYITVEFSVDDESEDNNTLFTFEVDDLNLLERG